jgi:5'-3' exonuclease
MPLTKLVLIYGHSLAYRAFYGLPLYDRGGKLHFTNARGEFTNAVYGFCNMLLKVRADERPDGIAWPSTWAAPSATTCTSSTRVRRPPSPDEPPALSQCQ